MSTSISPRFSSSGREREKSTGAVRTGGGVIDWQKVSVLSAVLLAACYGCSSPGSTFNSSGGTTGTTTGGNSATGTGGSSTDGSGGSTSVGTGGSTSVGTGGATGEGTGGSTSATGGSVGPGSGGGNVPTTGGTIGSTGGSVSGTGGRIGTGGTAGGGGPTGGVAGPACPKPAGQICHEFFAGDNNDHRILYVNEFDPTKNWTVAVGDTTDNSPRTMEVVDRADGKKVLVASVDRGYIELDLANKGALLARVGSLRGVSGAARLPDGNTALGVDAMNAIVIMGPSGTTVRSIPIPAGDNLRAINRNPADGSYWFSETNLVYAVNDSGTIKYMGNMGPVPIKGYAVWWNTATGGAWATTGEVCTIVEMNSAGTEVVAKRIGGRTTFAALGLDFFSGFVHLPSGNFVVANWLGHLDNADPKLAIASHLLEFSPANQVVWKWGTQANARRITNVNVVR